MIVVPQAYVKRAAFEHTSAETDLKVRCGLQFCTSRYIGQCAHVNLKGMAVSRRGRSRGCVTRRVVYVGGTLCYLPFVSATSPAW